MLPILRKGCRRVGAGNQKWYLGGVRVIGALLFLLGGAGTAYSTWATYHRSRPHDVLFGIAAPVALIVGLIGLLLMFVPGFFG